MNLRIIAACLLVFALFPFSVDSAVKPKATPVVFDPYTEFMNWAWQKKPTVRGPVSKRKPGPQMSQGKLTVEQLEQAIAPTVVTPKPKKPQKVQKTKKTKTTAVKQKKEKAVTRARASGGVSAANCARLAAAIRDHGSARVNGGGMGYSPADVAFARRACGV